MIYYDSISKTGGRPVNEDSVGTLEKDGQYLFALADGLGGHGGGEIASALVVLKAMEAFDASAGKCDLPLCFNEGQDSLMEEQLRKRLQGAMKTTLVLLKIDADEAVWGHIGDSRLYAFEKDKLTIRTRDHSVPQMLVNTGEIRDKDIRFHPDRNRLLRVMGVEWETPRFEISEPSLLSPGLSYLLCSDGFWELIDEKDICRSLKAASSTGEWLAEMEQIVLSNGSGKTMDNYSAVAVWIR